MLGPVRPVVAARELFVGVSDAEFGQFPMQLAIVFDQRIFGTAIEAQRRKVVAIRGGPVQQTGVLRPGKLEILPARKE